MSGVLALFWIWMGFVYHWGFFRSINPAASIFAVAFIAEGVLIAWLGVVRSQTLFEPRVNTAGVVGMVLIAYAILAYPAIGYWLGHRYPSAPTFGVPCPTTIFTFGMLLLCRPPRSRHAAHHSRRVGGPRWSRGDATRNVGRPWTRDRGDRRDSHRVRPTNSCETLDGIPSVDHGRDVDMRRSSMT